MEYRLLSKILMGSNSTIELLRDRKHGILSKARNRGRKIY